MATGWAHEGAVLDQIEDTITDGVLTARARLPAGEGSEHCIECGCEHRRESGWDRCHKHRCERRGAGCVSGASSGERLR